MGRNDPEGAGPGAIGNGQRLDGRRWATSPTPERSPDMPKQEPEILITTAGDRIILPTQLEDEPINA